MSYGFDDTTTNRWIRQPGPIHLRHEEHTPKNKDRDLRAASVFVVIVVIWMALGLAWLIWRRFT